MSGGLATPEDRIVSGNTLETQPENRLYFPALDGVRAVAFLLVFLQHYLNLPWGWTGVDLFFVLSGFLITGILYDTRDRPHRVRDFYVRRTLRIFPLFYGLCMLLLALTPVAHWQWNRYWVAWPLFLGNVLRFLHPFDTDPGYLAATVGALTSGDQRVTLFLGHLWSLAVEEQFYLVWPAVVFLVRDRRRLVAICLAVIVITPVLRVVAFDHLPHRFAELDLNYSFTPLRMDAFLMGGLAALLLRGRWSERVIGAVRWGGGALAAVAAVFLSLTLRRHGYLLPAWHYTWGLSVVDLLAMTLVMMAVVPGSWIYRALSFQPLRWLGRLSYGAYVFHVIAGQGIRHVAEAVGRSAPLIAAHARLTSALLALVTTVPLAWLTFHFFESPFLNLKRRFAPM